MSEDMIKNNISANIAYYRKKARITQAELASKLHTKNTTVSTWERGASLPDAETLFHICLILDISLSAIYGTDAASNADSFPVSDIERSIIIEYRKADEVGKAMVLRALSIDEKLSAKEDEIKMA